MKARGRRPSAFIVFECLETLMKPYARVFEIASRSRLRKRKKMEILTNFSHVVGKFVVVIFKLRNQFTSV